MTDSLAAAEADIEAKLSGDAFGPAGRRVVVEEGLTGPECSLLVLCDGERLAPLAPAQDFKRRDDLDRGPNTGGMGAYSPVPAVPDRLVSHLVDEAVAPLVAALRARSIDYRGVLYAGLMLTPDGPRVLEFNVRFGDPEAQVVLLRLESDLTGLLAEVAAGSLRTEPRFEPAAAVCVVCAAPGYPEAPRTGDPITGLADAAAIEGVTVLHAGTAWAGDRPSESATAADPDPAGPESDGGPERVLTAGGRVLGITGQGTTIGEARSRAYAGVSAVSWPGMQVRSDIALVAAAAETQPEREGAAR